MKNIDQAIINALKYPRDEALLNVVVSFGQPAFDRLVSRMYPCPGSSHPQEVDEKMCEFVERIAKVDPSIITNNITHKDPFARARVVAVAAASGNPEFTDIIVESLSDRSLYVVNSALWAVETRQYLRNRKAVELLRKLLETKRVNRLFKTSDEIKKLADTIEEGLPN